jgi:hypothetical protein
VHKRHRVAPAPDGGGGDWADLVHVGAVAAQRFRV